VRPTPDAAVIAGREVRLAVVYGQSLAWWSQWLELVKMAEQLVCREGLSATTVAHLREDLTLLATMGSRVRLAGELIAFVAEQCRAVWGGSGWWDNRAIRVCLLQAEISGAYTIEDWFH